MDYKKKREKENETAQGLYAAGHAELHVKSPLISSIRQFSEII